MQDNKVIIGIDPGQSGGFAVLSSGSVRTVKMPETYADIYNTLAGIIAGCSGKTVTAWLEDVGQGMPGQSSKATATFARHIGHLEMALYALGIRTEMVRPQKWQKYYSNTIGKGSGLEKKVWKNKLKAEAQRLFPSVQVTLWNADALLIAYYGKQVIKSP